MNQKHISDIETLSLNAINHQREISTINRDAMARVEAHDRLERMYNQRPEFYAQSTAPEIEAVEKPEFIEAFLNETVYTNGHDPLAMINVLAAQYSTITVYIIITKKYYMRIKSIKPIDNNLWHCELYDSEDEAIIVKAGSPMLVYIQ